MYYRSSGKFGIGSIVMFLFFALLAVPVLALIYTYLSFYIPLVYFNVLATAAFGFALGYLLNFLVIKKGKVRNFGIGILFAVLTGLIAMYFNYSFWLQILFNESGGMAVGSVLSNGLKLAASPGTIFSLVSEVNTMGTWGLKSGDAISGIPLTIVWIIEALIVIVLPIMMSAGQTTYPFCETQNDWAEPVTIGPMNFIAKPDMLVQQLESGDTTLLASLDKNTSPEPAYSVLTFYHIDDGDCYLTATNVQMLVENGEEKEETLDVVEYIKVPETIVDSMVEKFS